MKLHAYKGLKRDAMVLVGLILALVVLNLVC